MIYNISFDIAAVVILLLIFVVTLTNYVTDNKEISIYRALLMAILVCCCLDIATSLTISFHDKVDPLLNLFLNTLYFASSVIPLFVLIIYIFKVVHNTSRIAFYIALSILLSYLIVLTINVFTGILFSFDKTSGEYVHGPIFMLNYLFPFLYIVFLVTYVLKYRKSLRFKQTITFGAYIVLFGLAALIQAFVLPNVLLIFFAGSLAVASMLFALETPDYKELEYLRHNLELEVEKKTKEISKVSMQTIEAFVLAIDAKDDYTKGHSLRVAKYSKLIGEELGLDETFVKKLYNAAFLHDIGKIGIPDAILKKTERLTDEEFDVIKIHTTLGGEILSKMDIFTNASDAARHHHERYNGTGYPDKLAGENIPLMSRIIAVADAFDAMNSTRTYRNKLTPEIIRDELIKNSGTQFDPSIIPCFIRLWDEGKLDEITNLK